MKPKTLITLLVIAGLLVGGYFILRNYQQKKATAASDFQTETIKKGNLTAIVGATGTVHTNQSAQLSWQTTGRIDTIRVSEGQAVRKDDILAELDAGSLPQTLILAKADLISAQRNLDKLLNSTLSQAQAQLALVNAQDELEKAQSDYNWESYPRGSSEQVGSAEANLNLAKSQLDNAQMFFDMVSDRPVTDPEYAQALIALNNAKTAVKNAQTNFDWISGNTTPDATEAAAKLAVAQAKVNDAEREWNRLKDGPDPDDVTVAQAQIDALQATLDQVNLRAPFDGTITDVRSKPGDEVNPGTITFRVDDFQHMLVDVQVTEVDINNVQIGQQAVVTFDAIPSTEYHGEVVKVARVGVSSAGTVNFTVTIELTDADSAVLSGMTAAVNIVIKQMEDVLLVPNRAVRLLNGERVVYLLKNGVSTPVNVTIGVTSDNYSEILGGDVKEGDTIILNPVIDLSNMMMMGR